MPEIKKKSEECLNAAQKLIDCRMYNSSVHCSYYSAFLFMKYILAHTSNKPIDYVTQKEEGGSNSHKYVSKEIYDRVTNYGKLKDIRQLYAFLKEMRIEADYSNKLFPDTDSLDIIDKSKSLHRKLKDQFGAL